jgi:hypothetical protein
VVPAVIYKVLFVLLFLATLNTKHVASFPGRRIEWPY